MILAAQSWATNADLIADVAQLYIRPTDRVVDVTYGRGKWWTKYQHPRELFLGVVWSQDTTRPALARHNTRVVDSFTDLPIADNSTNVVCFDPPYIAPGGHATSTIGAFNVRYGLDTDYVPPLALHGTNMVGLRESARICVPRGIVLVKCMDYVSSGKLQPVTHWTIEYAHDIGLQLTDRFEHIGHARMQPAGRRQVHARRNLSTLLVFKKGRS